MAPDVLVGTPEPKVTGDSLSGTLPALPDWLTAPYQSGRPRLNWENGKPPAMQSTGLGAFAKALKLAGICDADTVAIPGALVLLPLGVALVESLAAMIRDAYGQMHLEEYAFPQVIPEATFGPMTDLLDVNRCLLRVMTGSDAKAGQSRGVLTPTGEQVIASHWRKLVRHPESLPLRIFQRARYFRPVSSGDRSGKGVFAALEAPDVFEIHCCHADQPAALNDLKAIARGLADLAHRLPLPQISGVRPPWGNRATLYEWAIANDTPLPSGECVQTSALYFQGQHLSKRYDIGFKRDGQRQHAWQIDAFTSRRMLFALLCLAVRDDGRMVLPLGIAPTQVALLVRSSSALDQTGVQAVHSALSTCGIRSQVRQCADSSEVTTALKDARQKGVPLAMLIFGAREPGDLIRIRLLRTDNDAEVGIDVDAIDERLLPYVTDAIADLTEAYQVAIQQRARSQTMQTTNLDEARERLSMRRSVVAPVTPTRANVEAFAQWRSGEACSFAAAPEPLPCLFSGRPTWARALLSRRI